MSPSKLVLIAALFLISCSGSDNIFDEKSHIRFLPDFSCEIFRNTMFLHGYIYVDGEFVSYNLSDLLKDGYLRDFFWIVNNDTIRELPVEKEVPCCEHSIKLFITDIFGDTANFSDSICIHKPEPLEITLLSPINGFELSETPIFEYKINKEGLSYVYVSTDSSSLWEEKNIFKPFTKLTEEMYFWGVKAFTEQDTTFSEIRQIWLLKD